MNMNNKSSEFESFIRNVNSYPDTAYVTCICKKGIYIFNKNDNKFHSSDNSEVFEFNNMQLYNYDETLDKHVLCIMVFRTVDELLQYISCKEYDKDIAKCMLSIKQEMKNYG